MVLGIPSTFMMCLDCWAGNLVVIFAGVIGKTVLAAQVVLGNIMVVLYMVGMGLEQAACSIVGNLLGDNNP